MATEQIAKDEQLGRDAFELMRGESIGGGFQFAQRVAWGFTARDKRFNGAAS